MQYGEFCITTCTWCICIILLHYMQTQEQSSRNNSDGGNVHQESTYPSFEPERDGY